MQGYYNMLRNHKIYDLVETYTKVSRGGSSSVVSGNLVAYEPSIAEPLNSYELQTSTPLTNFVPSVTSSSNFSMDARYQSLISFDQYDASNNILQEHKMYDENHAFIWDYSHGYPIAKVENAALSDIAYTSFEADGTVTGRSRTPRVIEACRRCQGIYLITLRAPIPLPKPGSIPAPLISSAIWSQNGALSISNGTAGQTGPTLGSWTVLRTPGYRRRVGQCQRDGADR